MIVEEAGNGLNHAALREKKEEGRRQLHVLTDSNVGKLQILREDINFSNAKLRL